MNYYQHHIGDYLTKTAHLTLIEHGAYRRLIDVYYSTEAPLPADHKQVYRLVMARGKEEMAAVDSVLAEFFILTADGYRQHRCDHEIGLCNKNRTNGKKGGRPSKNNNPDETQTKPKQNPEITQTEPRDNPDETQTKPKPKAPITQYPLPNTQKEKQAAAAATDPPIAAAAAVPDGTIADFPADPIVSRAIELSAMLRHRGAALQASDPRVRQWAADGVSDGALLSALEKADDRRVKAGSVQPVNAGLIDAILRDNGGGKPVDASAGRPKDGDQRQHPRYGYAETYRGGQWLMA